MKKTDFGLLKFEKDEDKNDIYINEYYKLKDKYINDSILNPYLKEIFLISHDYTKQLQKSNNKIHIIANMNNKYIYASLVSINSVLRNSNKKNTTIVYHILCPEDLRRRYINKLKAFLFYYPKNLEMIFYNMGNLFSRFKRIRFSQVAFYRLLTPLFIPADKIIYLDSDVIAFDDLNEMYNLNFDNNYVLGFLDFLSHGIDYLGIRTEKYINSGVLLINLDLIRKNKKYYEIILLLNNYKKLENNDQTVINYVFYPDIGILPFKYGIFNFNSIFDIKYIYIKFLRQNLNQTELIEAFNKPSLMHFILCEPKVWKANTKFIKKYTRVGTLGKFSCKLYHDIWIEYAKNTSFYDEIKKYYKLKYE